MNYESDILPRLRAVYDAREASALARLVLAERFGLTLTDIICGKVNDFSREDNEILEKIIVRLENNEPVQYILGYQDFCGHRFHVAPGVLIPRPETEELVEAITTPSRPPRGEEKKSNAIRILDIGTGSGCIAISLALALPEAQVEAWDISDDALTIARDNASRLGAKVTFNKVDVLTYTPKAEQPQYSVIVSNPPYICHREAADMDANVLEYEPHIALFVPDDDPLLFYHRIAKLGTKMLEEGGALWFEINRAYGDDVCQMMNELGYGDVRIIDDQFGNPRIVTGILQLTVNN